MMRHIVLIAGLAASSAFVAPAALAQSPAPVTKPADPFPPGDAHDLVAVACTQCHTAGAIQAVRMDEKGWRQQIEIMIVRGAQIGPDQIGPASAYLASAFGPGVPFPNAGPMKEVHLASGEGVALVEQGCGICHGLDRVVAANRPGKQWQAIVNRMAEMGASYDDDQKKQIVSYLEAHYAGPKR